MTSVLLTYNPHFGAFHKSRTDECQKRAGGCVRPACTPLKLVVVLGTRWKNVKTHDAKYLKLSIHAQERLDMGMHKYT